MFAVLDVMVLCVMPLFIVQLGTPEIVRHIFSR